MAEATANNAVVAAAPLTPRRATKRARAGVAHSPQAPQCSPDKFPIQVEQRMCVKGAGAKDWIPVPTFTEDEQVCARVSSSAYWVRKLCYGGTSYSKPDVRKLRVALKQLIQELRARGDVEAPDEGQAAGAAVLGLASDDSDEEAEDDDEADTQGSNQSKKEHGSNCCHIKMEFKTVNLDGADVMAKCCKGGTCVWLVTTDDSLAAFVRFVHSMYDVDTVPLLSSAHGLAHGVNPECLLETCDKGRVAWSWTSGSYVVTARA